MKKATVIIILLILFLCIWGYSSFFVKDSMAVNIDLQGTILNVKVTDITQPFCKIKLVINSVANGEDDLCEFSKTVLLKNKTEFTVDIKDELLHSGSISVKIVSGNTTVYEDEVWCTIWFDNIICHAGGIIEDSVRTNSLEAFESSYEKGYRTFETDLRFTSDNVLVLCHSWEEIDPNTTENYTKSIDEFLGTKICGKYTPMTFDDLIDFMTDHPDTWIITDTKYTDYENTAAVFHSVYSQLKARDSLDLLSRFIVQIYHENLYNAVNDVYPFNNYIFTMYQRWAGDMEDYGRICAWSNQRGIQTIVMAENKFSDAVIEPTRTYGLNLCLHTVNDPENAGKYLSEGLWIMTDQICP